MPTVSVIMSVYNGEAHLAEAIESILSQTLTDFELIIVDDGSQDESADIIHAYEGRDSRIRFFRLERNQGSADARNHGLAAASGEFVTIMDCDDISLPQRLEKQVAFLRANPQVGVVGASGRAVSEDLAPLFAFKLPRRHALIAFEMFVGVGMIYSAIMLRLAALNATGGYEAGRRAGEERELAWRLLYEGRLRCANLPDELLLYRRHGRGLSDDHAPGLDAERLDVSQRRLRQLWGEAPPASVDRFKRLGMGERLGMRGRRAAKGDMLRLIEALIDKGIVEAEDRQALVEDMHRRLDKDKPRLWRKFNAWRRYRLPWLFPDALGPRD